MYHTCSWLSILYVNMFQFLLLAHYCLLAMCTHTYSICAYMCVQNCCLQVVCVCCFLHVRRVWLSPITTPMQSSRDHITQMRSLSLKFCTQLTKAYVAETSCISCYWFCYISAHDQFARYRQRSNEPLRHYLYIYSWTSSHDSYMPSTVVDFDAVVNWNIMYVYTV